MRGLLLKSFSIVLLLSQLGWAQNSIAPSLDRQVFQDFAVMSHNFQAEKIAQDFLDSLNATLEKNYELARNVKLGLIDTALRKVAIARNIQIDDTRDKIQNILWKLRPYLTTLDMDVLSTFLRTKSDFLLLLNESLEAMVDRVPSMQGFAELTDEWAESLITQSSRHRHFLSDHSLVYKRLLDQATRERVFKTWVNRENIETVGLAALLAAQGVCIIVSAGVCAATIPGTASLTVKAGIQAVQSAAVVGLSSVDLIDRYRAQGYKGLISMSAVIDALLVASTLPNPSRTLLLSGYHSLSPSFFRSIASTQYQAGAVAGGLLLGYGSWQMLNAEKIANNLQRQGENVSADEIRRQGGMNLLFGVMGVQKTLERAQEWKYGTEVEQQILESSKISKALGRIAGRELQVFAPTRSLRRIYTKMAGLPGADQIPMYKVLTSAAYIGYSVLFYHAAAVLSVAYPDHYFLKRVGKPPVLAPGEIALTLNGFDPDDILYTAFDSRHARKLELDNYQEGVNYFNDTFATPEEFFQKIAQYGRMGRIKYLRILAHGVPGIIATRALDIEGRQAKGIHALIDADFMNLYAGEIRTIARASMAKNATLVITSCLVGANLEKPMKVRDFTIPKDAGDRFMKSLKATFMVNGGDVYSSRRIILGFEALYGGVWDRIVDSGPVMSSSDAIRVAQEKEAADRALKAILAKDGQLRKQMQEAPTIDMRIKLLKMLKANGARLYQTYTHIWTIIQKYGVNIEGPLYGADRFREDHFPEVP